MTGGADGLCLTRLLFLFLFKITVSSSYSRLSLQTVNKDHKKKIKESDLALLYERGDANFTQWKGCTGNLLKSHETHHFTYCKLSLELNSFFSLSRGNLETQAMELLYMQVF